MAICDITAPGEVKMAQQLKGLWKIYVRTEDARRSLLKSGVRYNNTNVPLFDYDPFSRRSTPSEKIVIRDLPMEVDDDAILQYFSEHHPHVHVRSKIMAANILDPNNKPTAFLNGDRYLYAESGFDPVLPKEDMIADTQCRIWHPSQELKCKRCFDHGHRAHEVKQCPAYVESQDNTRIFWKDSDVLSNFYKCSVFLFNRSFTSSEQCYHWAKLSYLDLHDLAEEVMNCATPREAKAIASRAPHSVLPLWEEEKTSCMYEVLLAKSKSCKKFKSALLNTKNAVIVEGTSDPFWGCMVPPPYCETCNIKYMKGQNALGFTLMDLRKHLQSTVSTSATVSTEGLYSKSSTTATSLDHQTRVPSNVQSPIHSTDNIPSSPRPAGCDSDTIIVHADVHRSAVIETVPASEISRESTSSTSPSVTTSRAQSTSPSSSIPPLGATTTAPPSSSTSSAPPSVSTSGVPPSVSTSTASPSAPNPCVPPSSATPSALPHGSSKFASVIRVIENDFELFPKHLNPDMLSGREIRKSRSLIRGHVVRSSSESRKSDRRDMRQIDDYFITVKRKASDSTTSPTFQSVTKMSKTDNDVESSPSLSVVVMDGTDSGREVVTT